MQDAHSTYGSRLPRVQVFDQNQIFWRGTQSDLLKGNPIDPIPGNASVAPFECKGEKIRETFIQYLCK